jgi:predicted lipoprotein with Yx(FWY)xxD motif
MRNRWLAVPFLAAAAVVGIAACGSNSTSSTPSSSGATSAPAAASTNSPLNPTATGIKTMSTSLGTVLVDAQGYVLYWYAPDTSTASNCNGSCATYWPPVIGTPTLASGVTLSGKLGTIKRSNGQLQATYDGHPLYTFASDKAPGDATGNDLNASGGLWWAMTPSGTTVKAASGSSGSGSSGSGSGSSGSGSGGSSGGSGGYGY